MNYKTALNNIEELKAKIAEDEAWLPRLHSKKMIERTKWWIELNKKLIAKYEAELPALKAEWKAAEIARLTAELEAVKAL